MTYGGRPAETASLGIGGATLAVFTILRAYGVDIPEGVPEASLVLVGGVATVVTWWVNRRAKKAAEKYVAANPAATWTEVPPAA